MLVLLSPAKNMNFDPAPQAPPKTKPILTDDAAALAETARALSASRLRSLMRISENLAALNHERFQALTLNYRASGAKQAALAFNGDVYHGLEAHSLDADDLQYAQNHLRILSGLYGVLRPLDGIEPYRLEMGSRLNNPRGENLYDWWGERIARALREALRDHDDQTIVNLASKEYFAAVDRAALNADILTPVFKEEKDGERRQLQFFAKRARGMMARWVIKNRIERRTDLTNFREGGYRYQKRLSTDDVWVFTRPQPPKKN